MIEALNSKVKANVLKFLVANKEKEHIISDISKFTGNSNSRTSEALQELEKMEIVKKKYVGRSIAYKLNKQNTDTKEIIKFIEQDRPKRIARRFTEELREELGEELVSCVLFGSQARGTSNRESDIDLLIITKKETDLKELVLKYLKEENVRISPITITKEQVEKQASKPNPLFYGIILGYEALHGAEYFESVLGTAKERIRQKEPLYVEGENEWNLAKMI